MSHLAAPMGRPARSKRCLAPLVLLLLSACPSPLPEPIPTTVEIAPAQSIVAVDSTQTIDVAVCTRQPLESDGCPEVDLMPGRYLTLTATGGFLSGSELDLVAGRGTAEWSAPAVPGVYRIEGVTDDGHGGGADVRVVGPLQALPASLTGLQYGQQRQVHLDGWIAPLTVVPQDGSPLTTTFDEETSILTVALQQQVLDDDTVSVSLQDGGDQQLELFVDIVATPVLPTEFRLEADDAELVASPLSWTRITAVVGGAPDQTPVTLLATAGSFLGSTPAFDGFTATQVTATVYGERAYALWQADAAPGTVFFIGQLTTAVTEPLSIELIAPPSDELTLTPSDVWMAPGQTLPFSVAGGSGALHWSSVDADLLLCDGGDFVDCTGEDRVDITVDPSWDSWSRPSLTFWVTDADTGEQAQATITPPPGP